MRLLRAYPPTPPPFFDREKPGNQSNYHFTPPEFFHWGRNLAAEWTRVQAGHSVVSRIEGQFLKGSRMKKPTPKEPAVSREVLRLAEMGRGVEEEIVKAAAAADRKLRGEDEGEAGGRSPLKSGA